MTARRLLTGAGQGAFALAVAFFGGRAIWKAWTDSHESLAAFSWGTAALAVPAFALAYLSFLGFSKHALHALGVPLRWKTLFRVWAIPQAASYVPGKVWWVLGRYHQLRRLAVAPAVAVADLYVEEAAMVVGCIGIGIAGVLPFASDYLLPTLGASAAMIAVAVLLLTPPVARRLFGRLAVVVRAEGEPPPPLPPRVLVRQVLLSASIWLFFGAAFVAVCFALSPRLAGVEAFRIGGAYALAWMAGVVSMLPGGFVAREGLLVVFLGPVVGQKEIVAAAAILRGVTIGAEMLMAALATTIRTGPEAEAGPDPEGRRSGGP